MPKLLEAVRGFAQLQRELNMGRLKINIELSSVADLGKLQVHVNRDPIMFGAGPNADMTKPFSIVGVECQVTVKKCECCNREF